MNVAEKLGRIIDLLEELVDRTGPRYIQKSGTLIFDEVPSVKCQCRGMRIGSRHNYGCPLYKQPSVQG